MAKDDISICNTALSRIGVTTKIASLTERTKEAIELNSVFEEVRDRVISAAPWPFARRIIALQKTGATPFRWKYRYEYPSDCIAIRNILPPMPAGSTPELYRRWLAESKVAYEIEADDNDYQTIVTDQDLAVIEYTKRVINPLRYSAKFTGAFAWALAAEVALPLAKTIDHSRNAAAAYEKEIREAIADARNQQHQEEPADSEFVRARL